MSCCVNFCKNRSDRDNRAGVRFYRFPSDPKRTVLWLKAARRWDLLNRPSKHRKICSMHFVTGKFSDNPTHPDYVPSIFPFNKEREYSRVTQRVQRFIRQGKRAEAAGASPVPLFAPGHPSGPLHGHLQKRLQVQQLNQPPGADDSRTFVLLVYNPPEGSTEQAIRMDYEIKVEEVDRFMNAYVIRPGDHSYCKSPHSAPVEPQRDNTETTESNETHHSEDESSEPAEDPQHHREPDQSPEPQEPQQLQETGKKVKKHLQKTCNKESLVTGNGQNETNAAAKEAEMPEAAQNSDDSQNKRTESQSKQSSVEKPIPMKMDSSGNPLKPLLCPICGQYFWTVVRFAYHVQKHVDERYQCKVCDKKMRFKFLLDSHMAMHSNEKNFRCEYCDKRYSLKKSLQFHMKLHLSGFDCTYCGMQYRNEDDLEKHLLRHEEKERKEKEREREQAERERAEKERAERSKAGEQGFQQGTNPGVPKGDFKCDMCGKSFKKKCKLNDHIAVHMGVRQHQCSLCPKRFLRKEGLQCHMQHHKYGKRFSCSFCEHKFYKKESLDEHTQSKHTGKTFECSECGQKFSSNARRKRHAKVHTPYSCSVCRQEFKTLETAEEHLEVHRKERESSSQSVELTNICVIDLLNQFLCTECGKTFRTNAALRIHVRFVHCQERSFSCSFCDLKFKMKHTLNVHMRIHTGEKPFSCSVCQKRFRAKAILKLHMVQHSGTKPFACTICGAQFHARSSLKVHSVTHITGKPFPCPKCPRKYKLPKLLKDHMRLAHGAGEHHCSLCLMSFMTDVGLRIHTAVKHITVQNPRDETSGADVEMEQAIDEISEIDKTS